jgi:hypothetical protein
MVSIVRTRVRRALVLLVEHILHRDSFGYACLAAGMR